MRHSTSHRLGRSTAALLILGTLGLLGACSGDDDPDPAEATPTSSAPTSGGDDTGTDDEEADEKTSTGQSSDDSGTRPRITSFSTPENIDCHNGNFQEFTASWSTQNATKTTMSIDGGGIYETYGPSAEVSLPFNCSSPHTFKLTALDAAGHKTNKSITLQPRNAQTDTDDQDDEDDS